MRSRITTLEDVYAIRLEPQPMSLGGPDGAERVYGVVVMKRSRGLPGPARIRSVASWEWMRLEGPMMRTVVGVTADAKLISLNAAASPFVYVPIAQRFLSRTNLVVRTTDGRSAIPPLRALVREMNSNLHVTEALPLTR